MYEDEDPMLLEHEWMQRELEAKQDKLHDAMLKLPDNKEEAFLWMESHYGADNPFDECVFQSAMEREDFVRMVITSNWRVIQFVPRQKLDATAKLITVIKSRGEALDYPQ